MSGRTASALLALGLAVTLQTLLEALLPGRAVPNLYILTLVYLCHHRGRRWRVDGAFWSGLVLGAMLRQPPGAYSLAALLALAVAASFRKALARRSSAGTLLEVTAASLLFDLVIVLLLGRPVLLSLPAYLVPLASRMVLTVALFLATSLVSGLAGLLSRAPAPR